MSPPRPPGGFTIVEILVVLAILGLTAAAVVPALARATEEDDVTATARGVERVLLAARTTALERAARIDVELIPLPEAARYWVHKGGALLDSGTIVLAGSSRIQSPVPRPRFRFGPTGIVDGDSLLVLGTAGARVLVIDRWTGAIRVDAR